MNTDNYKDIPIITIDGPSGTGKGTVCHALGAKLHWHILDSGLLYRKLAWTVINQGINIDDLQSIISLGVNLSLDPDHPPNAIRSEACGQMASKLAIIPEIRE